MFNWKHCMTLIWDQSSRWNSQNLVQTSEVPGQNNLAWKFMEFIHERWSASKISLNVKKKATKVNSSMWNSVSTFSLYQEPQLLFWSKVWQKIYTELSKMSINKEVEWIYNYTVLNIKYARTVFKFPESLPFTKDSELHWLNLQVYKVCQSMKTM